MTLAVELILHRGDREIAARFQVGQEVLAIVGPNGAGKTSLLLAMLGLRRAHAGRLVLGPRVLFDATNHIDVPTDRRAIGYVPQDYALFPHLTALGNVEFALGCAVPAPSRASRRARAEELLHSLGIHGIRDRWPATLSGGEKQRLALARALATQPQALLLDEPLAALDVGARREVRRSLGQHLRALGLPALVVTHDLDDVRVVADRVLVLEEGRIVQEGTLAELASCPATAYIEQFVHPHRMAAPVS